MPEVFGRDTLRVYGGIHMERLYREFRAVRRLKTYWRRWYSGWSEEVWWVMN